ncbi:Thiaminase-2 [Lentilactobacillus parabuchneri]|jgi:thiaminase/transcriptional activator TenA|uniref:Aminopyrimidine aminohydrolase n=4 Tax=Lentilactobacillus parabuchneri TaxID=152331 RepID=A0A1X1FHD4_9LACO|nr:thiaminase II [Lentilactobacillus parabuchneri]APR06728.1 Thiaminase-2 [Lentilactobacillus parabuchneri]MBW0222650.1 thiaminase II [Lentilactobacillus parabuchneri]MBW0245762.1 thiaminase II [Lentilactobacillus parabuchneri]MBW0264195.1 thiaminase II [Lentilactobacillus parabuchneri]MCT2884280.1 thiaminase II [Lentilactobacillus parabuchneri]
MTKITDIMRQQANPLWEASFNHPFIEQLSTGALSPQTFRYYLKQDRFYLENFAALHGKIADQIDDPDIKAFLYAGAEGFNDSEKEVRKEFFSELKITQEEIDQTHIAPTAYSYVTHMYHELNEGTPARAAAALLPCYWLYNEIGKKLIQLGSPIKIYQRFIETYESPDFTTATDKMIQIVDQLAETADQKEQQEMIQAFVRSSYFELHFWEMAYQRQEWS